MTNLDSILKGRDITLPTRVHLVKAMVFPLVIYGCESWTIKKAEHERIDIFELEKTLKSPLDCKEIKPVHPKGNQSWIFTGRTDAKAEAPIFGHLMWRANSVEKTLMLGKIEGRRRRGSKDEMVGWHHQLNGHEFEQAPWDGKNRESWPAAVHGEAKCRTQLSDWTTTTRKRLPKVKMDKIFEQPYQKRGNPKG